MRHDTIGRKTVVKILNANNSYCPVHILSAHYSADLVADLWVVDATREETGTVKRASATTHLSQTEA
jgi:hypothetical protein